MTEERPSADPPEVPQSLDCEVSRDGETWRLQLAGALDLATARRLDAHISAARAAGARLVILDLRQLRFMDSSGLRCILAHHQHAQQDGFDLQLTRASPAVQRVFDWTGTTALLPFQDTPSER